MNTLKTLGVIVGLFTLGAVLILGASTMFMSVQPYFMGWRRENVQQSLQYTTTQVQQLVNFKTAYEALEVKVVEADDNSVLVQAYRNQQVAIIGQMRSIAALIPAGEVPASIQVLINRG